MSRARLLERLIMTMQESLPTNEVLHRRMKGTDERIDIYPNQQTTHSTTGFVRYVYPDATPNRISEGYADLQSLLHQTEDLV